MSELTEAQRRELRDALLDCYKAGLKAPTHIAKVLDPVVAKMIDEAVQDAWDEAADHYTEGGI